MLFKEIAGHTEVKKRLVNSVKENRVSHAQLFLGPEGSGNLAMAIAYAQYVNCENRANEDSCGACLSCLKFSKLAHPDLHFIFPVNTTKSITKDPVSDFFLAEWREALSENPYMTLSQWLSKLGIENKQGNISTKEGNEIIKKLSLKNYEGQYKIMVIWMPENLNATASNKILKILEEPPDKTLFLLVCNQYEKLLTTILSRTQLVKINAVSDEELAVWLTEKHGLDKESAQKVAALSEGNVLEAMSLIESEVTTNTLTDNFISWMRICYRGKVDEMLHWLEPVIADGRESQKSFLTYSLYMLRESMAFSSGSSLVVKASANEKEFLSKFSPFIHQKNAPYIAEELDKAAYHIERNLNSKIVFTDLSLKLMKLLKVKA
jgi:DNA polymerase III subunit delta'